KTSAGYSFRTAAHFTQRNPGATFRPAANWSVGQGMGEAAWVLAYALALLAAVHSWPTPKEMQAAAIPAADQRRQSEAAAREPSADTKRGRSRRDERFCCA